MLPPLNFRKRSFSDTKAFTLVEVTLAIGIIAFAFVSTLGLVPIGLTHFRKAMDTSISSQIFQQVVSDLQQSEASDLAQSHPIRYFDEQGVAKGDASRPPTASEMAKVLYNVNTITRIHSPIPGEQAQDQDSSLATVVVEIVKNPGKKPLQKDPVSGGILEQPAQGIYVSRYFAYAASPSQASQAQ